MYHSRSRAHVCVYLRSLTQLQSSLAYLERHLSSSAGGAPSWPALRFIVCDILYGGRIGEESDRGVLGAMVGLMVGEHMMAGGSAFRPDAMVEETAFAYRYLLHCVCIFRDKRCLHVYCTAHPGFDLTLFRCCAVLITLLDAIALVDQPVENHVSIVFFFFMIHFALLLLMVFAVCRTSARSSSTARL